MNNTNSITKPKARSFVPMRVSADTVKRRNKRPEKAKTNQKDLPVQTIALVAEKKLPSAPVQSQTSTQPPFINNGMGYDNFGRTRRRQPKLFANQLIAVRTDMGWVNASGQAVNPSLGAIFREMISAKKTDVDAMEEMIRVSKKEAQKERSKKELSLKNERLFEKMDRIITPLFNPLKMAVKFVKYPRDVKTRKERLKNHALRNHSLRRTWIKNSFAKMLSPAGPAYLPSFKNVAAEARRDIEMIPAKMAKKIVNFLESLTGQSGKQQEKKPNLLPRYTRLENNISSLFKLTGAVGAVLIPFAARPVVSAAPASANALIQSAQKQFSPQVGNDCWQTYSSYYKYENTYVLQSIPQFIIEANKTPEKEYAAFEGMRRAAQNNPDVKKQFEQIVQNNPQFATRMTNQYFAQLENNF